MTRTRQRWHWAGAAAALLLLTGMSSASVSVYAGGLPMEFNGWTNCVKMSNGDVELVLAPRIGGRIMAYRFPGGTNVAAVNPSYYGAEVAFAPPKQVVYYGGSKMWPSPQNWGWPPNAYWENAPNLLTQFSPLRVQMAAPRDAASLLRFTRSIELAPSGTVVTIRHMMENVTAAQRNNAIWTINAFPRPSTLIAPVGSSNWCSSGASVTAPWVQTNGVYYTDALTPTVKLFVITNRPWVAGLYAKHLWIQWGDEPQSPTYPSGEAPVEIWYGKDPQGHDFAELELQGPNAVLPPGGKTSYTMYWRLELLAENTIDAAVDRLRQLGFLP